MNTIENNKLIADLQERLRLKEEALEKIVNAKTLKEAKDIVNTLNEAEVAVDMVQRFITPRIPMWIGVEIPTFDGFTRVCVGLNQEDGDEVSFCNNVDVSLHNEDPKNCPSPWVYGGNVSVSYADNGRVFNDNHELIK